MMGRYGMLDCKTNFSMGYGGKLCVECNTDDNEAHRINECAKYRAVNKYDCTEKINFENIYSDELDDVMIVENFSGSCGETMPFKAQGQYKG